MSGSTFQCSTARKRPVRPRPVWISSATNSVPCRRQSSAAALQIAVGGHVDALALDRLDDERRDLARRQRALERGKIVEGNADAIGQQRLEAVAEHGVAVERQRAVGQAVIGVVAEHQARPSGRGARELDRGLHGLGAGVGEEHLVEIGDVRQAAARPECRRASRHRAARDSAGRCRARSVSASRNAGWLRPMPKTPKPLSRSR